MFLDRMYRPHGSAEVRGVLSLDKDTILSLVSSGQLDNSLVKLAVAEQEGDKRPEVLTALSDRMHLLNTSLAVSSAVSRVGYGSV